MATEEVNAVVKIYRLAVKNLPILKYSWVLIATICVLALASYLKIKNTDVFSYVFVVLIVIFLCIVLSYFASKTDDRVVKFITYIVIGSIAITVVVGVLGFGSFILFQKPIFYNRWFPNMKFSSVEKSKITEEKDSTNQKSKSNLSKEKIKNPLKKSKKSKNLEEIITDEKGNSQLQYKLENNRNDYDSIPLSTSYNSEKPTGIVRFDYSNNNGKFTIGTGQYAFETMWTKASDTQIYAYKDAPGMKTISLVTDKRHIKEIVSVNLYDASSRVRTPKVGEIIIWQNTNGYFAATKIIRIKDRDRADNVDELVFEYVVNTEKTNSFAK